MTKATRADAPATREPSAHPAEVGIASTSPGKGKPRLAGEDRHRLIAEAAYFHAEHRGFAPGAELDDWLRAELEIDALYDQGT